MVEMEKREERIDPILKSKRYVICTILKEEFGSDFFGSVRLNEKVREARQGPRTKVNKEHRMPKPFRLIKSVLGQLLKPKDIYPPIRPKSVMEKAIDDKVLLDSTFATVKSSGKSKAEKKEPKPTDVVSWEDRRKDDTIYSARAAVLIGFPMAKPKPRPDSMHLIYKRGNGDFQIRISADAEFGMPFGQDQIIVLALLDEALRNGNPKVGISSIYRILKDLGMSDGGKKYQLTQQSLLRIFGSSVSYWYKDKNGLTGKQCHYFKEIHLEILKDKYDFIPENGNYIVFSDEIYNELQKHRIPYDIEMIRRLKSSPGAVRLYLWAAQRSFRIKSLTQGVFIPYCDLANDIGSSINVPREFRRNLKAWIGKIDRELKVVSNKDFLIEMQDNGVLLKKQDMVPGSHRQSNFVEALQKKVIESKNTKKKKSNINWDLEKEIDSFETGLTTSLSQAAVVYMRSRKSN